jgi:hypothetical protein
MKRTVNDRDVPNLHTIQSKQSVQTSTVNDRDVPKSIITQTRQSVQKSTIDRENKVTPPKHRDLKLNISVIYSWYCGIYSIFLFSCRSQVLWFSWFRISGRRGTTTHTILVWNISRDFIYKQPVQKSTVNDRDVPNSHTAQSKQPVQKSTVNDRDADQRSKRNHNPYYSRLKYK